MGGEGEYSFKYRLLIEYADQANFMDSLCKINPALREQWSSLQKISAAGLIWWEWICWKVVGDVAYGAMYQVYTVQQQVFLAVLPNECSFYVRHYSIQDSTSNHCSFTALCRLLFCFVALTMPS